MPPINLKKGENMDTIQYILLAVFVVATIVGYLIINKVPSLLHTPLMSGMNALSGVTVVVHSYDCCNKNIKFRTICTWDHFWCYCNNTGTINVVGGFAVTHRMLKMFHRKGGRK